MENSRYARLTLEIGRSVDMRYELNPTVDSNAEFLLVLYTTERKCLRLLRYLVLGSVHLYFFSVYRIPPSLE